MIVRVEHDLRMPLDAQSAWIIDQFNGFHDAVLRTAADAQTFSKIPDTLVMIAVGPDPIAEQAVERAARFQMNQMADITAVRGLHVLTKMRASMVCEPSLAFCARDLELGQFMLLGKGEENTGGRRRDSITSDGMEAMIGAIYLDGGMQPAKAFIDRFILSDLEDKRLFYDSKSNLQELIQGKLKKEFEYRLLEESGPEHDKTFVVEIDMEGECLGRGQGRTKKAAEQQAAYEALLLLRDRGYVFKKY